MCRGAVKVAFAHVQHSVKRTLYINAAINKTKLENDVAASASTLVVVQDFLVKIMDNEGEVRPRKVDRW